MKYFSYFSHNMNFECKSAASTLESQHYQNEISKNPIHKMQQCGKHRFKSNIL